MTEEESSQVPQKTSTETEPKGDIESLPQIGQETPPCPVPAEHVKVFEECCDKYEKGEMTGTEVMDQVRTTLKGLKKEEKE